MTDQTPRRTVRFLRERTGTTDQFGAHSRLADALAQTLMDDQPLQVVGLLGNWGSGKSTVVHLVEKKLKGEAVRFFLYDAWLHQSDAPRRAFLEELVRWVKRQALGDTTPLEEKLDRLLGKSEKTETTVRPSVSIGAGLALALLLLAPLASQFLRRDWMEITDFGAIKLGGHSFSAPFLCALAICAAPCAILAILSLLRLLGLGKGHDGGATVALFANKISEVRTDLKIKDPDPTALEFQKFLRELLDYMRARTPDRLVFVVDNLDRLPEPELLTLWSTIRSLFHGDPGPINAPVPPTVLLPIDETAIVRLHGDNDVAAGFADKTFDVIFRLPTPVLTQWQCYLDDRLREAFGADIAQVWIDAAARVLEDSGMDGRTPRSINAFVNQTATLWMQWGTEVSFAAIAFYSVHRLELEKNIWQALQHPFPWMIDFDSDWMRGVAALRYGAAPETAGQILIEAPLREAIAADDHESFVSLSKHVGFMVVFRRLIDGLRRGETPVPFSKAALMLLSLADARDQNWKSAWNSLADGLVQAPVWRPMEPRDVEALRAVLAQVSRTKRAAICRAFAHNIGLISSENFPGAGEFILASAQIVLDQAKQDGVPLSAILLQVSAATTLDLVAQAGPNGMGLELLKPHMPPELLASALADHLRGQAGTEPPQLWLALAHWAEYISWPKLVQELWTDPQDFPVATATPILPPLFKAWQYVPESRAAIQSLTASTRYIRQLSNSMKGDQTALVDLLALSVVAGHSMGQTNDDFKTLVTQSTELGEQVELKLAEMAPQLALSNIVDFVDEDSTAVPLLAEIVSARLRRCSDQIDIEAVAKNPMAYLAVSECGADDLWRIAAQDPRFLKVLAKKVPNDPLLLVMRALVQVPLEAQTSAKVGAMMADKLSRLPVSTWREQFFAGGPRYEDLFVLAGRFEEFPVSGTLETALDQLISEVVLSGNGELAQRWARAVHQVSKAGREGLVRKFSERVLDDRVVDCAHLVHMAGSDVLNGVLVAKHANLFLERVLTPLLADTEGRRWIVEEADAIAHWLGVVPARLSVKARDLLKQAATGSQVSDRIRNGLLHLATGGKA